MLYHIWQLFFLLIWIIFLIYISFCYISEAGAADQPLWGCCEPASDHHQQTGVRSAATYSRGTATSIQYFTNSSSAEQSHRKRFVQALSRMRVLYMSIFWQTLLSKAACIKGIHFYQFLHYLGTKPNVFLCSVVWGIYIVGTLSVIHCDLPQEGITMALKSSILSLRDFYSISMK